MHEFDATSVTVVIPTTARRPTLRAAIASAVNQEPAPSRILVVDDSAESAAKEVVADFGDKRVEWTPNKRASGPSGARNTGLALAATPIVAFLDDDDCYEPGFLKKTLETWNRSSPDTIAIWTAIVAEFEDGTEARLPVWTPKGRTAQERLINSVIYSNFATSHGLSMNRKPFLDLGGFNESLRVAEDTEALYRVLLNGSVNTIDECLIRVRRFGSDRQSRNAKEYAKSWDFLKLQYAASLSASPVAKYCLERARMRWHMLAGHKREGRRIVSTLLLSAPLERRFEALAIFISLLVGVDPKNILNNGRRKYVQAKQRLSRP